MPETPTTPKRETDTAFDHVRKNAIKFDTMVDAYCQLLDRTAREADNPTLVARTFVQLREIDDIVDDTMKKIDKLKQFLSVVRLPELYTDNDMTSVSLADLAARVQLTSRTSASILDQEKAFAWLRANNFGAAIKETVQANTLARVVKEFSEEHAKDPPADAIKVTVLPYVTKNKL